MGPAVRSPTGSAEPAGLGSRLPRAVPPSVAKWLHQTRHKVPGQECRTEAQVVIPGDTADKHKRPVIRLHRERGLSDRKKPHPCRGTLHLDSPQGPQAALGRPQLWLGCGWAAQRLPGTHKVLGSIPSTKERKKRKAGRRRAQGAETSTNGRSQAPCAPTPRPRPRPQPWPGTGPHSSTSQGARALHAHSHCGSCSDRHRT